MSKFSKSSMTVNGNSVQLSMPFAKVDKANRLVSGYATLDNIDTQGDVVLAEASAKAFARARGNIREMHQPIAVGKMVDFREDEFYDPETQKFYRGIFVTARVSKGAEDTWEKVLDETLTGFSIGGEIKEASNEFNKEAGKTVRFIKDYDLTELSLVDNPANQLANVLSIQKNTGGSVTVKMGEVSDTVVENVFVCNNDTTVVVKATESETCPMCDTKMENAGWFEAGADRAEKVKSIVTKFLTPADKEAAPTSEGGVEMGKKEVTKNEQAEGDKVGTVNPSEEQTEENPTSVPADDKDGEQAVEGEESEEVDETAGTEEEEATASPDEVEDEATEISKKIDELHRAVEDSLESSAAKTNEKVEELAKKIDEATASFISKTSELEGKISSVGEKLETAKSRLAEFENALNKMNRSEAVKKSADVETASTGTSVQKDTTWNGAFSGGPGNKGFSVDNLS